MRSALLSIAGLVALAAGCGGRAASSVGNPGDAGTDGAGGSGSGSGGTSGSSSGGGSGSSSGGTASSGGSSSGSSSGATDAQPPQGVNDAGCPYSPPLPATVCAADGVVCGWGNGKGPCGESCSCEDSAWQCQIQSCPPDVCPVEPSSGAACMQAGLACFYAIVGGCGDEECDCSSSGTWSCVENMCVDASAPSDGGSDDGGGYCPLYQPPNSAPCSDPGTVCSYYTGCETNCLCASSGWVCAAQQGCVPPPQPDL